MRTSARIVLKVTVAIALWLAVLSPNVSLATDQAKQRDRIRSLLKEVKTEYAAGQFDSVLVRLIIVRNLDPGNQDSFYYAALTYLELADTSQAEAILKEGIEQAPMSSRIKLLLIRLYLDTGRYNEADSLLDTLFRFKPRDAEALYLRGLARLSLGDTSATLESWQKALESFEKKGAWQR